METLKSYAQSDVKKIVKPKFLAKKRIFDLILAVFLTIFFSIPLLVIALWIKLSSKNPVIFWTDRRGVDNTIFKMAKFRTMKNGTPQVPKHLMTDPGAYFILGGAFLRKYSLDELPQIFNVLLGDMSLVGPRPLPIDQVEKEDFKQLKRLEVKPGITGLWQIRGRSDISFARLVKWDIWYINNWSFWLDINILLQTIPAVFKGRGAY